MKKLKRLVFGTLFMSSVMFALVSCDNDSELEEAGEEVGDAIEEATDG